jgi:hypothetical protein
MAIGFTAELSHYTSAGIYATQARIPAAAAHDSPATVATSAITEEYVCPLKGPPYIPVTWHCEINYKTAEECCYGPTGATICCPIPCPTRCDGLCVDSSTDSNNCGGCGNQCSSGEVCCNGVCCAAAQCCDGGVCCPAGTGCVYGGCCVPNAGALRLNSNSNYVIANCTYPNLGDCQSIEGLNVAFQVEDDMVAAVTPYAGGSSSQNGGFTIQLNANNPVGPATTGMQYVFLISGNQIQWQVQYWGVNPSTGKESDLYPQGGTILSSLPSNTIPAGYLFEIQLNNDFNGNVSGGTFNVTDNHGKKAPPAKFTIDQNYLYPIRAFEVDIVGPDNSQCSEFSSGGGTLTYSATNGELCVAGGWPGVCSTVGAYTCETSNATYGPTYATYGRPTSPTCCSGELSQSVSFDPSITCPYPVKTCG